MSDDTEVERRASTSLQGIKEHTYALVAGLGIALGIAGTFILGPNWWTWMLAVILVCGVVVLRQIFGKKTWREDEEDLAGASECPHCGSLQTDSVTRFDEKGREYRQMHCFACDTGLGERTYLE